MMLLCLYFVGNRTYMAVVLSKGKTDITWSLDIGVAGFDAAVEIYEAGEFLHLTLIVKDYIL